jgi:hypothetical protein
MYLDLYFIINIHFAVIVSKLPINHLLQLRKEFGHVLYFVQDDSRGRVRQRFPQTRQQITRKERIGSHGVQLGACLPPD